MFLCAHSSKMNAFGSRCSNLLFLTVLVLCSSMLQLYSISSSQSIYWHSPLYVIRSLGTVGQGVSCKVLQERFQADSSPSSVRRILAFLRQQPGPLHTSLVNLPVLLMLYACDIYCIYMYVSFVMCLCSSGQKKCVIEELYQFEFFSELLTDLGAEIALSMP